MRDVDFIRKHLPKGWRLHYELTLVPDDGRPPKVMALDAIQKFGERARKIEADLDALHLGLRMMAGPRPDESEDDET